MDLYQEHNQNLKFIMSTIPNFEYQIELLKLLTEYNNKLISKALKKGVIVSGLTNLDDSTYELIKNTNWLIMASKSKISTLIIYGTHNLNESQIKAVIADEQSLITEFYNKQNSLNFRILNLFGIINTITKYLENPGLSR